MLSKLLKHEFRATGRIMLPLYGAVAALAVLANLSIRVLNVTDNTFVSILFGLIVVVFGVSIAAAAIATVVVMIVRFYRNLLGNQGYLMHTLPATVHQQIWAKLIVSLVWIVGTFLVVWLLILATVLIQSGTNLGDVFAELPSWKELKVLLAEAGIHTGSLTLVGIEVLAAALLSCLVSCLHCYAAMSLGQMFSRNKILLSIVFYVGISILFTVLRTGVGYGFARTADSMVQAVELVEYLRTAMGGILAFLLVQGAALYAAAALCLKKRLNLA